MSVRSPRARPASTATAPSSLCLLALAAVVGGCRLLSPSPGAQQGVENQRVEGGDAQQGVANQRAESAQQGGANMWYGSELPWKAVVLSLGCVLAVATTAAIMARRWRNHACAA